MSEQPLTRDAIVLSLIHTIEMLNTDVEKLRRLDMIVELGILKGLVELTLTYTPKGNN